MITSKLCLAAGLVIRDADSNTLSIISILEGFMPASVPVVFGQLSCLALWIREANDPERTDGTFNIRIDAEPLSVHRFNVDFQGHPQARTVINLAGMVVPHAGLLTVQMTLDTGAIAEYSFRIAQPVAITAPAAGPEPPTQ